MTLPLNLIPDAPHEPRPASSVQSATSVCPMLRTKTAFGSYLTDGDDTPWQSGESTTAVYWCLRTMCSAGPDEAFVHPSMCMAGRSCYRALSD